MIISKNRDRRYMVLIVIMLLAGLFPAHGFASKVHPLLETLRLQKHVLSPKIDTSLGRQIISSPIPLSDLAEVMDFSMDGGTLKISCLIKITRSSKAFERLGIWPSAHIGDIFSARLTLDQLDSLMKMEEIIRIEPSFRCKLNLDTSRKAIRMDVAQNTFGLDGKDVIVGLVDAGIDVHNRDFTDINDTTKTRILYVLNTCDQTGSSPLGYGTEYTENDIDQGIYTATDVAGKGHGTHVLGIACGNGLRTKRGVPARTYLGIAFGAKIICVDFTSEDSVTTSKIVDAAYYIADKAHDINMPCVINISIGTLWGPRDGSSLFEQAISDVTDLYSFGPATIVTTAAGNKNYVHYTWCPQENRIHARAYDNDTISFFVGADSSLGAEKVWLQIWYPGDQHYWVKLLAPDGDTVAYVGPAGGTGPPGHGYYAEHGLYAVHNENYDTTGPWIDPYPNTYDREIYIFLGEGYAYGKYWHLSRGVWKIAMDSGCGRWDVYRPEFRSRDPSYIIEFSSESNIDEPGNAGKIITVGAFTTKVSWLDPNSDPSTGDGLVIGDTCYFSARGPTRDNRPKPDILAPGAMIASSVSDAYIWANRYAPDFIYSLTYDSAHLVDGGTSQASPHIAGLIALMLQTYPNLTYNEILNCLKSTANQGKVDAYNAIKCVIQLHCQGRCGDANHDGSVNVSDAVWMINYVFSGGSHPLPVTACGDANSDRHADVSDAVWIINFIYAGGQPPGSCMPGYWSKHGGICCPY